jgi:hypothetical protein
MRKKKSKKKEKNLFFRKNEKKGNLKKEKNRSFRKNEKKRKKNARYRFAVTAERGMVSG